MRLSVHVAVLFGVTGLLPLTANAQTNAMGSTEPPPIATGQAQPPATLSPSQQMPSPPRVSYSDGKLTVTANNSTILDVINAVRGATGTAFHIMGGPMQDRLFGQYGPGTVNTVLEQILRGSGFNYILVSAPNAPGQVKTATLMAKSNEASTPAISQPRNVQTQQNDNQEPPPDANSGEDETQQPEPAQEEQPPAVNPAADNSPMNPNAPKTPEQLLQELQHLQQLRQQQQQQQQNNTNPQ